MGPDFPDFLSRGSRTGVPVCEGTASEASCSRGGALTALILPEFHLISVSGREDYWEEVKRQYKSVVLQYLPRENDPWSKIEEFLYSVDHQGQLEPKLSEHADNLRDTLTKTEKAFTVLEEHIVNENTKIIGELRCKSGYDAVSENEQGRIYAARIGRHPFAYLFHQERRGRLTKESLRKVFKSPGDALRRINELSSAHPTKAYFVS